MEISCAVAFIEKLNGPSLNLSPEEFDGYMLRQRAPSSEHRRQQVCDSTQHLLEELRGRQERLDQGMDTLNLQLQTWMETVTAQLDETTAKFALVQKEITAQAKQGIETTKPGPSNAQAEELSDHKPTC